MAAVLTTAKLLGGELKGCSISRGQREHDSLRAGVNALMAEESKARAAQPNADL